MKLFSKKKKSSQISLNFLYFLNYLRGPSLFSPTVILRILINFREGETKTASPCYSHEP